MADSPSDPQAARYSRVRVAFWSLWGVALLLKLQFATMIGTMDIVLYSKYGKALAKLGFAGAYASDPNFNIPPVAAGFSALLVMLFGPNTNEFAFFLKLPGIVAEAAFAVALWRRYGHDLGPRCWIALLAVCNPVSIPITGLHGNFDGLLAAFLGMALLMAIDGRVIACAIWFGLAANLKVAPVLVAPAFFFWWWHRGRAWEFSLTAAIVVLVGWSPGLIASPVLFAQRVIGYSSLWGTWGLSRLLYLTGSPDFSEVVYGGPSTRAKMIGAVLKLTVVGLSCALAWRRRKGTGEALAGTLAAVWVVFFIFAPGGAPQYMVWPVVPLLFYRLRLGVVYLLAATPFMFVFYPFAFVSLLPFNPYALLAEAWPDIRSEYAWTWPALFLWTVLVVMLVGEWNRWWKSPDSDDKLPLAVAGREC